MPVTEDQVRELVRRVLLRTLGPAGLAGSPLPNGPAARSPLSQVGGSLHPRPTIGEADVLAVPVGGQLAVPAGALVTPLARDTAADRGVELALQPGPHLSDGVQPEAPSVQRPGPALRSSAQTLQREGPRPPAPDRTVALGADHGGFALKEDLKTYLAELGYRVTDCGTHSTAAVDYPDYAYAVAALVADNLAWRGIIVDGAGIGSCMAANKVPGVRAALCYDHATAVNSREHNDANVLTLGGGLLGRSLARQIVKVWLETDFGGGRHARRVEKILEIERRFLK